MSVYPHVDSLLKKEITLNKMAKKNKESYMNKFILKKKQNL